MTAGDVDAERLASMLGMMLEQDVPALHELLMAGELRWALGPPEDDGNTRILLFHVDTGEEMGGVVMRESLVPRVSSR